MSKKYEIIVKEVLERSVNVIADSREEALAEIERQYNKEEIVLNYSDCTDTNLIIKEPFFNKRITHIDEAEGYPEVAYDSKYVIELVHWHHTAEIANFILDNTIDGITNEDEAYAVAKKAYEKFEKICSENLATAINEVLDQHHKNKGEQNV